MKHEIKVGDKVFCTRTSLIGTVIEIDGNFAKIQYPGKVNFKSQDCGGVKPYITDVGTEHVSYLRVKN